MLYDKDRDRTCEIYGQFCVWRIGNYIEVRLAMRITNAPIVATTATNPYEIKIPELRNVFGTDQSILRNPNHAITSMEEEGVVTEYVYAQHETMGFLSFGLLEQVTNHDGDEEGPEQELVTTYEWDEFGRLTDIHHPIGDEQWTYGDYSLLLEYSDDIGTRTSYSVNGLVTESMTQDPNDLALETAYTYTDGLGTTELVGLIETITDPNGVVTHYYYSEKGLLEEVVYAEGSLDEVTVSYAYDERDRITSITDGREGVSTFVYDDLDRLIERYDPDPDDEEVEYESPDWEFRYDASGNQTHVIDPQENVTQYVYDARNRVFQVIQPIADPLAEPEIFPTADDDDGTFNSGTWSSTIEREGSYDDFVSATSDNGGKVTFEFDELDPTKKYEVYVRWTPSETPDEYDTNALFKVFGEWDLMPLHKMRLNLNATPQEYLEGSELLWLSMGAFSPFEETLTVTLQDDDNNGKLVIDAVQLVEVGPVSQTNYDCSGNVVRTIDPLNNETIFYYDDLDRLVLRSDADPDGAGGNGTPYTLYTYNSLGWLLSAVDPAQTVTLFEYDEMGRVTKEVSVTEGGVGLSAEYRDDNGDFLFGGLAENIDFSLSPDFAGQEGLPSGFSVTWTGAVHVPEEGNVTFYLENTDESELFIDNRPVIHNQSTDAMDEVDGSITLNAGWHAITITFDDTYEGDSGLVFSYLTNMGKMVVPIGEFSPTYVLTLTEYDAIGRATYVTDASQRGMHYEYDGVNRVTRIESVTYDGESTYTPVGPATDYAYDGQVISATNDLGDTTVYFYDNLQRLASVKDANGDFTKYSYDDAGNLVTLRDANNNVTTWSYDYLNRVIEETINSEIDTRLYKYDDNSNLVEKTDRNGRVMTFEYDTLNRLTAENWLDGGLAIDRTITYGYDSAGNVVLVDDPSATYTFAYDGLRRVSSTELDIDDLSGLVQLDRGFDEAGRLTSTTATVGGNADYRNDYSYDYSGRLASITQAEQSALYEFNAVAPKHVTFSYDLDGRLTSVGRYADTSANNFVLGTDYYFDDRGRLEQIDHSGQGGLIESHVYGYDNADRLTSYSNLIDGIMAEYDYDARGQLTGADYDSGLTDEFYTYDENGNRVRDTEYTPSLGDITTAPVGAWAFDAGSTSTVQDGSAYNNDGTISGSPTLETDLPFAAMGTRSLLLNTDEGTGDYVTLGSNALPSDEFTVSLWFKAEDTHAGEHGIIEQVLFSQGDTNIRINYDGQLVADLFDSTSASATVLISSELIDDTWYNVVFRYDGVNMMFLVVDIDGNYDAGNYQSYPTLNTTTPQSGTAYLGRDSGGGDYFSGQIADVRIYDEALADEDVAVIRGLAGPYVIGDYNRLQADGTNTYLYDAEGNRTAKFIDTNENGAWNTDEEGVAYTWDHRNRLISVTFKNDSNEVTKTVDYKYDALNQLVYRVLDSDGALEVAAIDQTVFVYDDGQVVLQFDKSGSGSVLDGNLSHRYLWGLGTDMLLADEHVDDVGFPGEVLWAAADHLGSVRDVVDSNGTVRIHRQFDSYGNIVSETHYDDMAMEVELHEAGFVTVAFAFTGRYFDTATGLQNNLNRWFDAVVGSWISEDPIGFAGDGSNVYRPMRNALTMYVDPNGLATIHPSYGKPTQPAPIGLPLDPNVWREYDGDRVRELEEEQRRRELLSKPIDESIESGAPGTDFLGPRRDPWNRVDDTQPSLQERISTAVKDGKIHYKYKTTFRTGTLTISPEITVPALLDEDTFLDPRQRLRDIGDSCCDEMTLFFIWQWGHAPGHEWYKPPYWDEPIKPVEP